MAVKPTTIRQLGTKDRRPESCKNSCHILPLHPRTFQSPPTSLTMPKVYDNDFFKNSDCPAWSKCNVYPCRHIPSHDPDWLEDRVQCWADNDGWREIWEYF